MKKKLRNFDSLAPRGPGYRLVDEPGLVEVSFRTGSFGVAGFMAVFLCGWSAACALLLYKVSQDPKVEHILFAVPFLVGWVFAFLVLINMLLGREKLRLDARGARFSHRLIFEYGVVEMPLDELLGFGTAVNSEGEESGVTRSLELRTIGRPIRCGGSASTELHTMLTSLFEARLRELQQQEGKPPRLPRTRKPVRFGRRLAGELLGDGDEMRTSTDEPIDAPADSRWREQVDFDAVTFVHPGRWTTGGVIGVLMINLFWSVITGFFWYQLFGGDPKQKYEGLAFIEHFIFLLPFTLVGLAMFLGLLLIMLEPVRRYRWRFTRTEATCKLSWFGLGKKWRTPLESVDHLEVRFVPYQEVKKFHRLPLGTIWTPHGCPTYTVAVVDARQQDACTIAGLTQGEAMHFADVLVRSQTHWFV